MLTGDLQNQEEIEFLNEKVKLTERLIAENKLLLKIQWVKQTWYSQSQ